MSIFQIFKNKVFLLQKNRNIQNLIQYESYCMTHYREIYIGCFLLEKNWLSSKGFCDYGTYFYRVLKYVTSELAGARIAKFYSQSKEKVLFFNSFFLIQSYLLSTFSVQL